MKNSNYDISLIRRYLNGELDVNAMYQLERQAQDDPMLMDIINGMEWGNKGIHDVALASIDRLIDVRTSREKRRTIAAWKAVGIAASLLFVAGLITIILLKDTPAQLAVKTQIEKVKLKQPVLKSHEDHPVTFRDKTIASKSYNTSRNGLKEAYKKTLIDSAEALVSAVQTDKIDTVPVSDEVAVVSYSSQSRSNLTAAVASVNAKDIESAESVTQIRVRGGVPSGKLKESYIVKGTVLDATDRKPIPGVSVKVKGADIATTTDVNGRFSITLPDKDESLEAIYIGYEKTSVKASNEKDLVIALHPASSALSEVMVGKNAANDVEETQKAHPAEGWREYRKYIRSKTKVAEQESKGVIVLSFIVSATGTISDVKIIKGLNERLNQRALDLLLNGPEWLGDEDGNAKEIKLRIKFHD